jgi:hypothetical protein
VSTNSNGVATASTLSANGTAGSYSVTASVAGVATPASFSLTNNSQTGNFSLSASPGSQTVTEGGTGSYTVTVVSLGGFMGKVTFSASGLPAGTTANFLPPSVSGAGTSAVSLATAQSTPVGVYTVTITGTSGALQSSSTVTLVVNAHGVPVIQASLYKRSAIITDERTFGSGDGDELGNAYSANLLGWTVNFDSLSFTMGSANVPDVATSHDHPAAGRTIFYAGDAWNGSAMETRGRRAPSCGTGMEHLPLVCGV